jgi:F-type H+-transporting ATPase subunit delta
VADRAETGARVYAEALHRAAVAAGRVPEVDRDLRELLEALAENRQALATLLNPQIPVDSRRRIIAGMMKDGDPLARNAIMVLSDNGRLSMVRDVVMVFAEMAAQEERILDIEVTTAVSLDSAQTERIEQRIEKATGLKARIDARVDPAIIGGLVLRARGVLLDASVKRELDEIHRALINTPLPVGSEA